MNLYPLYQGKTIGCQNYCRNIDQIDKDEFENFEETDKAQTGTLRPNS
jgi:hypothetical protein